MSLRRLCILWLFVGVLVSACARDDEFATENIVGAFGGSTRLSSTELACVEQRPKLKAALLKKDPSEFSRLIGLASMQRDEFDCFSARAVKHLVPEDSDQGRCWRRVLLASWADGLESGQNVWIESGFQPAKEQCGPLKR